MPKVTAYTAGGDLPVSGQKQQLWTSGKDDPDSRIQNFAWKFTLHIYLEPESLRTFATRTLHTPGGCNLFWERLETLDLSWKRLYISTHLYTCIQKHVKPLAPASHCKPCSHLFTPPDSLGHSPKCAWPRKLHWSFSTSPRPA